MTSAHTHTHTHTHLISLHSKNNTCTWTPIRTYQWADGVGLLSLTRKKQYVASPQPCLTLKYTAACSLSFHLCPSLSFSLPPSSTGNMDRLLHICKWITLCVEIFFCVWIVKMGKRVWEGKGAPAIALFFSSLYNPEEDKLWGTQRGSAIDLLGSSTS